MLEVEGDDDALSSSSDDEAKNAADREANAAAGFGAVDDEGYETLVVEIKEVLAELAQDKAMDAFRGEYEKLYAALEKSHRNEKRLNTKCQELASEIANQQARVDAAHDKGHEDQDTIASLKKEIEKAWKMVDMTQEREERARETIETLNTEIQNLTKVIEEKTLGAEDTNLNELRKLRDELVSQRDSLKAEVGELNAREKGHLEAISTAAAEKVKLENRISQLSNELQSRTNELNREIRRKERTEREVKQLKTDLEEKEKEVGAAGNEAAQVRDSVAKLEKALVEQRILNEDLQAQTEALKAEITELQGQVEQAHLAFAQLESENVKKSEEIVAKDENVAQGKLNLSRSAREIEELKKKLTNEEKEKEKVELDRVRLKEECSDFKRQVSELRHTSLVDKKHFDAKCDEISALEHALRRLSSAIERERQETQTAVEAVHGEKRTVVTLEGRLDKQLRVVAGIEEERDHYLGEAQELAKRADELLEEVRDAEAAVFAFRKEVSDRDAKIRQQQNLYRAARNDRSILDKTLTEAQDEIADLKGKLRVLQHQFDQLKEEMVAKEAALSKSGQDHQRLLKDKEELHAEVEKARSDAKAMGQRSKEAEKNYQMVSDRHRQLEKDLEKAKVKLDSALRERSALDRRVAKKEEEMEVLKRKASIQETVLARGEEKYQERIEDIRVLKLEIKRMRQDEAMTAKGVSCVEELRKEALRLQKDLLKEKTKSRALQTELDTPLNVHRWRRLEGSDPSTFELVQKVQALQKRLIARKEDLTKKDMALAEKDKSLLELRTAFERQQQQHGANNVVSVNVTADGSNKGESDAEKKLKKELALLASQSNMKSTKLAEMRQKTEKLADELSKARRKYLDLNKKYQPLIEERRRRQEEEEGRRKQRQRPVSAYARSNAFPATPKKKFVAGGGFILMDTA